MAPDLDPVLEDTARRRLAALVDAISVPHALSAPGPSGPKRRAGGAGRRRVLVAVAAVGIAAATTAAVVLPSNDGPDTVTDPSSNGRAPSNDESLPDAGRSPGGACESRIADDGLVAGGTLPSGQRWDARAQGEPPNVSAWVTIDGERVGGTRHDERSWPGVVNDGFLSLDAGLLEHGTIVTGEVPLATASVEVHSDSGEVAQACPVRIPTVDIIGYFGVALPPGTRPTQTRALDSQGRVLASGDLSGLMEEVGDSGGTSMDVDPSLVSLPLGGSRVELPPEPVLEDIVTGELPGGSWSLASGQDDDGVILELSLPNGSSSGVQATPELLVGPGANWNLDSIGGRLILWGPAPPDVATVTVTLNDGATVDVPTVETVPPTGIRAFATILAEGATPTEIVGHRSDGLPAVRVTDVAEQLGQLSVPDAVGGGQLALPVVPVP